MKKYMPFLALALVVTGFPFLPLPAADREQPAKTKHGMVVAVSPEGAETG